MRIIAGGSVRSLRSVGGLLALASAGAVASFLGGGLWYLAIGDLVGDRTMAATSAMAGALAIWVFVTLAGVRMTVRQRGSSRGGARRQGR